MLHNEAYRLLPDYVLDALDPAERREVDAHLDSGCVECQAELKSLHEALLALIDHEGVEPPPARVKEELLSRIGGAAEKPFAARAPKPPISSGRRFATYVTAATLLLAVGLSMFVWFGTSVEQDDGVVDEVGPAAPQLGIRLVDFALGGQAPKLLKHAIYDETAGEMHVWVNLGNRDEESPPHAVQVVDANGAVLATSRLQQKVGVAGAVIYVPDLPQRGKLAVVTDAEIVGEGEVLEALPFQLR
ncbi:MAG: zf-HC2 domain-containing protein [Planctomycetota bacterium]